MNDNTTYKPKPVACKVVIWGDIANEERFMSHERFEDYVSNGSDYVVNIFSQVSSNVNYIDYWNTSDLTRLAELYKVESDEDFPENRYTYQCVGIINNKQIFLAYIGNATTPYVRIDNYVAQGHESFFKYYGSDSMVKRLSSYPIIGYGFPAYLAVHSRIGSMILYQGSNQTNIDTLIEQYYKDRYDLYRAINSNDYEWIDSNIKSKFYGTKAKKKKVELYKTFLQHLLKQEKECFKSNNTELLTLFNGELNENIECFLDFIQEKLAALEPKQDAPVNKPQQRKPQDTQENHNEPTPNIRDIIQSHNKKSIEDILKQLHVRIDGKAGAAVGAVFMKAKFEGYLSGYPSEKQFLSEFSLNGKSWKSISNYFNENDNKCLSKAGSIIFFD